MGREDEERHKHSAFDRDHLGCMTQGTWVYDNFWMFVGIGLLTMVCMHGWVAWRRIAHTFESLDKKKRGAAQRARRGSVASAQAPSQPPCPTLERPQTPSQPPCLTLERSQTSLSSAASVPDVPEEGSSGNSRVRTRLRELRALLKEELIDRTLYEEKQREILSDL